MSADTLTASARAFYEQTRFKMAASIFLASMSMMALAWCSTSGGQSNSANFMHKAANDDKIEDAQQALAGGYGFGSFMFFVAFAVFLSAAIYISPMFCGTNSEKKMISKPQEVDAGYSAYTENPVNVQASAPMGGAHMGGGNNAV